MDKFNFSSIVAVAVVPVVSSIITVATSVSDDVFGRILSSREIKSVTVAPHPP